jgi:nucleoside-diphosphate kinase
MYKLKTMAGKFTFTMIKPSAVESQHVGIILQKINQNGFRITSLKMIHLSKDEAARFYAIHKERPFYNDLVEFMSSGPIVAAILEKENAVEAFRQLIGATDPAKAEEGTIRKLCGTSIQHNAVHGSDSDENAVIEANFFFGGFERF